MSTEKLFLHTLNLQFEKPKLSSKVRKVKRNTKKESCVGNRLITNFKDNSEHELNL